MDVLVQNTAPSGEPINAYADTSKTYTGQAVAKNANALDILAPSGERPVNARNENGAQILLYLHRN
jgi:hypothetical protein